MLPKVKSITYYWLPLIAYCVFIYIQSSYPSLERLPSFEFSDKLLHFAAYAVMGVLFYRAYQTLPLKNNIQLLILLSMISASLYGISDEIHQSFVPYRDGSLLDVVADVLGAVCGVYLYHLWMMGIKSRRQRFEFGSRNAEVGKEQRQRFEFGCRNAEVGKRTKDGDLNSACDELSRVQVILDFGMQIADLYLESLRSAPCPLPITLRPASMPLTQ